VPTQCAGPPDVAGASLKAVKRLLETANAHSTSIEH
jgi:hypothetical protein